MFNDNGVYGIIGPNGAGKTTLLECICGLLAIDSGEIIFDGKPLSVETRMEILQNIGAVFSQSDGLFDRSISELLDEHFYFFGLAKPKKWHGLLETFGLNLPSDLKIGQLSLGMRQRFLLAVAMSHHPKILILDEPFNGLDPDGVELLKGMINDYAQKNMVILTSHSLVDLEEIISHAIVMANGHPSEVRPLTEIQREFSDGLNGFYHKFSRSSELLGRDSG